MLRMLNRTIGLVGKILLVLGVLALTTPVSQAGTVKDQPFNLDDLYSLALERSEKIQASQEDLTVALTRREVAKSVMIPKLTATGGIRRYSEQKNSGDALLQPEWSGNYGLRLDQSFTLNGRELIALHLADDNIAQKTHALAAVTEAYLFEVATAYYSVARAEMGLRIAEANTRRLATNRDSVKMRLEVGTVTQTDLLRTEAELSSARADQVRLENEHMVARAALARLVDLKAPPEIVVPDTEGKPPEADEVLDLDDLRTKALTQRSELAAAQAALGITAKQVKLEKSEYWPRVSLEAAAMGFEQHPDPALKDSTYIGASLTWMIYDGGLRKAQIAEARAVDRQAELTYQDLVKSIGLEVEEAYRLFSTQQNALAALEDQLRFADENYTAVTKQFENGLANSVDVVDANTLLVTAQQQLVDAVLGLQWARLGIDRAQGTLRTDVEQRLGLGN